MSIKNNYIRLISALLLLCVLISQAYAQGGGLLMGIQGGTSNLTNPSMLVATGSDGNDAHFPVDDANACMGGNNPPGCVMTSPSNSGLGLRIYMGAGFNKYVAVETGLLYFTPSEYKPDIPNLTHEPQIREYAFDVLARFTLPVQDFGIFAKGGMAVIYKSISGALETNSAGQTNSGGNVYFRPEIGAGVSYSFSVITIDISTNRILKGSGIDQITYNALGVTYQVTDKYCGQFLC